MTNVLFWELVLGVILILVSGLFYVLDYLFFGDLHGILNSLLIGMAFLPIQILLVTMVLERLLAVRDKKAMLRKLNMVIEVFFNEVGTPLMKVMPLYDGRFNKVAAFLQVEVSWTGADFRKAREASRSCDISVNQEVDDLVNLHNFLLDKRDILLHLLENPNLLEHESFTDLLWAVFHLYDELYQREFFDQLPVADVEHLSLDIRRVFTRLVPEWIGYMEHLQQEYPYLFSLAVRTNPFAPQSTVIFK